MGLHEKSRSEANFISADVFRKNNSKIKAEPLFSMPKARRPSPFGLQPGEKPTIGPGAHELRQHLNKGVRLSPARFHKNLMKESRARIDAAVGPGSYSYNLSSL